MKTFACKISPWIELIEKIVFQRMQEKSHTAVGNNNGQKQDDQVFDFHAKRDNILALKIGLISGYSKKDRFAVNCFKKYYSMSKNIYNIALWFFKGEKIIKNYRKWIY
jgi:hypothetical protein